MGNLVLILVFVVGLGGAIWGFALHERNAGREAQKQLDAPKIAALEADKTAAVAANTACKASNDSLMAERAVITKATEDTKKAADEQAKTKDEALGKASVKIRDYTSEINLLRTQLVAPANSKAKTCNEALSAVDTSLRQLAAERVRDDAQARAVLGLTDPGTANKGAGSDSLRLSK